jgi:YVTN family beta-propeller protein
MNVKQALTGLATGTTFAVLAGMLAGCGGGGDGGGASQSSISEPVSSGSSGSSGPSANPIPTIDSLTPNCAPAGEQFIDGGDNQLTVVAPYPTVGPDYVAGSVVRWNGSDRPTTVAATNGLTAQIPASDIAKAGTALVTVFNPAPGGGSSNSLPFTVTPGGVDPESIAVDPAGKFAYVLDGGCGGGVSGYVSMYTINPTTGALASIGPPVPTYDISATFGSVTVDPSGKFVYVTNPGDIWAPDYGSVVMYTIDATTGALTSTGTINGNCPGLCFPSSMVVDPSGKFAYFLVGATGAGFAYNFAMYTIDATTGALTSIGSIAAGEGLPYEVAVDPAGKFVYVATLSGTVGVPGSVFVYAINATTGALASIGTIAAGTDPFSVAVDPADRFAYVTNYSSNDVSMYTIDATTGALTSIGTIAAGTAPQSVAVDPASRFAYVTNSSSNDVSMYSINATTGALTSIGTIAAGSTPTFIAISPSGQFVYVTNSTSNDVSMYSIGSTGTLTLIATIGS